MKKVLFLIVALCSVTCLWGTDYTIRFNSGGSADYTKATSDIEDIVLQSSDNCVKAIRYAQKIYRAKDGFGIKGGTGSEKGILTLQLDTVYAISQMTVYAAAANKSDTADTKGIAVCGTPVKWESGHKMKIYAYTVAINHSTDSITISSLLPGNNRWYIEHIDFIAEDPRPEQPKITAPLSVDFGTAKIEDGEPAEDVMDIQIIARNTTDSVQLHLKEGRFFSLGTDRLSLIGGEANIAYRIDKQQYYYDTLYVTAINRQHSVVRSIPLKLYGLRYTPSYVPIDSSKMHFGAMPCNYYQPAQGTKDSVLKAELGKVINCGARYRYGSGKNHTWAGFFYTDRDTITNQVLDMYSNNVCFFDTAHPTASVTGFDIEHMLPKSWWGGEDNNAYKDLFHLVPANYSANRSKSNHAPGIPSDSTFNNGSFVTGSGSTYGLTRIFCPADEYKGDFARAYFYIVTCYDTLLHWQETGEAAVAMTNDSYLDFRPWLQELLISWHRLDPVSEKEKVRAIEVNKIQGNRNPFIDYPELAEYIWGNRQGEAVNFYTLEQSYGDHYCDKLNATPSVVVPSSSVNKVLHNGQLYILKDGVIYTVLGLRQ